MNPDLVTADSLSDEELHDLLWRAGNLRWLLHEDQRHVYDAYREWQENMWNTDGLFRRVFMLDCSRRWGKEVLCLVIKMEDCLRNPGTIHIYATAHATDIGEIVIPLMDELLETCPPDIRPVWHAASQGKQAGYYYPNGSYMKCAGVDKNPNALRGRACDGGVLTEAAYIKELERVVTSVLVPQFMGRPTATCILQSSAPEFSEGCAFDEKFLADAQARGAYVFRTIEDNPLIDDEERENLIASVGGPESHAARREYYGERVRDPTRAVVPEYDDVRHVGDVPVLEWCDTYVTIDPGVQDLCGVLYGYWHHGCDIYGNVVGPARLMIQREYADYNMGTEDIAREIQTTERELWPNVHHWQDEQAHAAPYMRVSDTDPRLCLDLSRQFGLLVGSADKTDSKEARTHALRQAFVAGSIQIDPRCVKLRAQLKAATWNEKRTDWLRTEAHGHFDLVACLEIMWRAVVRGRMAVPPPWYFDRDKFVRPAHLKLAENYSGAGQLQKVLGGRKPWQGKGGSGWQSRVTGKRLKRL